MRQILSKERMSDGHVKVQRINLCLLESATNYSVSTFTCSLTNWNPKYAHFDLLLFYFSQSQSVTQLPVLYEALDGPFCKRSQINRDIIYVVGWRGTHHIVYKVGEGPDNGDTGKRDAEQNDVQQPYA